MMLNEVKLNLKFEKVATFSQETSEEKEKDKINNEDSKE